MNPVLPITLLNQDQREPKVIENVRRIDVSLTDTPKHGAVRTKLRGKIRGADSFRAEATVWCSSIEHGLVDASVESRTELERQFLVEVAAGKQQAGELCRPTLLVGHDKLESDALKEFAGYGGEVGGHRRERRRGREVGERPLRGEGDGLAWMDEGINRIAEAPEKAS